MVSFSDLKSEGDKNLLQNTIKKYEQGIIEITLSYYLMLTIIGGLASGFWFCFDLFLTSTPQGDNVTCFTYLSGEKKIILITFKRKSLSRILFIQTSFLWKVNNFVLSISPDLISSDQFYQFCSQPGIASDVLFITTYPLFLSSHS